MDRDEEKLNPYQAPRVKDPPWFRWSRVPYGLYRAYRGYVDQMRKDGGSPFGHLICWIGILLFGTIALALIVLILASGWYALRPLIFPQP